jgi:hypothetical protein
MTRIAQSYWQAELSRKAEGVILRSLLWGFIPVIIFLKVKNPSSNLVRSSIMNYAGSKASLNGPHSVESFGLDRS